MTWQTECVLLGATTTEGAEVSTAASKVSAACAATSGETAVVTIASGNTVTGSTTSKGSAASSATSRDTILDAATSGGSVVVYAAQTYQKAIHIMGSTLDRGISSGTGGLKWVGLGCQLHTSGSSTQTGYQTRILKDWPWISVCETDRTWQDSGWWAETWRDSGRPAET